MKLLSTRSLEIQLSLFKQLSAFGHGLARGHVSTSLDFWTTLNRLEAEIDKIERELDRREKYKPPIAGTIQGLTTGAGHTQD